MLIDAFGRQVTYLRLSVTDRCDMRCTYCMAEKMEFLPRKDLLSVSEMVQVCDAFISRGVKKIRITGGEPLVRKGVQPLLLELGSRLGSGLEELTLTTNGSQLSKYTDTLIEAGVKRINVSLDTLDPVQFQNITRTGDLSKVLDGIEAARAAGLRIKINTVALKNQNASDIPNMIEWAHEKGFDITLIEVMPMGNSGPDRFDQYIPLLDVRARLEERWTLEELPHTLENAGPARYVKVGETGGRLGFITPLTNNFCSGCNRMRVTCTGRIYMCLGNEDYVDLRAALRGASCSETALNKALNLALAKKSERHHFAIDKPGQSASLNRLMSVTGG